MKSHPRLNDVIGMLVNGELRNTLSSHYHSILHRVAEISTSAKGARHVLLGIAYRIARRLGLLSSPAVGELTWEMNLLALLDIVYRGPEYKPLIEALDKDGKETLALYISGLACQTGVQQLCEKAKTLFEEKCRLLEAIRKRIHVIRKLGVSHTSGRPILLVRIYDPIGPPRLLTDSLDILTESIATIKPNIFKKIINNATSLAVLDVGAYNGETSTRYAALMLREGIKGTVYAIEPDPVSYKLLEYNARLLGHPIRTIHAFLASNYGYEMLVPRGPSSSMSSIAGAAGKVRIRVIPAHVIVERALNESNADHLHVRIDTEGAEDLIINDLINTFKRLRSFSAEIAVYHRLGDLLKFYNKLKGIATGFTLVWASCDFRDLMLVAYRAAL